MPNNLYTWEQLKDAEAQALSKGEFQGTMLQALQDIRKDITEVDRKVETVKTEFNGKIDKINLDNRIKGYINMALGGIAGIVAGIVGSHIKSN